MDSKIEVRQALLAFERIISQGHKTDEGHRLNGITAVSDFDGYTATLKNDYVNLNIQFHNTFSFNYTNTKERDIFLEKLNTIIKGK